MLIEITSVSRTYQRGQELVKAVDDVTLTLGNENLSAITGASGSGRAPFSILLVGSTDQMRVPSEWMGKSCRRRATTNSRNTVGARCPSFSNSSIFCPL